MADKVGEWDYHEGCPNSKVTWADRMGLAMKIMSLPARMVFWSSTSFVTNPDEPVFQEVKVRTMGYISKSTSIPQLRIVCPIKPIRVTLKSSQRQAKDLNNYNGIFEGSGFSARWIHEAPDRTPDDPVIIFLHGGGYAFKLTPPLVTFAITAARALKRFRCSLLVLDYTVTPFSRYPGQLQELANCYNTLTSTGNCRRPILLGDSCGANLALALLQHIKYPVKDVPVCSHPVWACGMVSPWVSLVTYNHGSYTEFKSRDLIDAASLDEMCQAYCDETDLSNPVVNPIMGSTEYWEGVLPKRQFTVWGACESMRDSCREFAVKARLTNTFEEPRGLHDCLICDLRRPGPKFVMDNIAGWLDSAHPNALYVQPVMEGEFTSETDTAATARLSSKSRAKQQNNTGSWRWTWKSSPITSPQTTDSAPIPENAPESLAALSESGIYTIRTHSDPELSTYKRVEYELEGFSPKKSRPFQLRRSLSALASDSFSMPNKALSFCVSATKRSRSSLLLAANPSNQPDCDEKVELSDTATNLAKKATLSPRNTIQPQFPEPAMISV
ncbi:Putative steryl acetyl hydrolase mug81 [Wickerhamiella sorbophila]|uniref:Steryl acetyl hydrolase mug81 n=1 Tax=Wickerhamiella sorbophila TaxID=45607 RepID=A0A2T0FMU2_9ASCO|nr:Putative steryl acetyl hydrolase mug81 [Wickerhamiella sorbophila]PRT56323.1 Putative steryl acetyl hydrolase mug81 [Wickerhamiella sorbophila]